MDSCRHVRARAPLRLGLAGGGTDLDAYSSVYGGAVLNVTIARYAHASVKVRRDQQVILEALDLGLSEQFTAGELSTSGGLTLHAGVYNRIVREFTPNRWPGVEIKTFIEAQPGSGLGSSSALTVALVEAFRTALSLPLGRYDVAHLAYEIERIDLRLAGGKQDHYAAAFGGLNYIEFLPNDKVIVNPLRMDPYTWYDLQSALLVCYSGQSRQSDTVIKEQVSGLEFKSTAVVDSMHQLKEDAAEMKLALLQGNFRQAAGILDRSWAAKKSTASNVTNKLIEELWSVAHNHGAFAGKISGAGGGGYIMFFVDPDRRPELIKALSASGGSPDTVVMTSEGVESWRAHI